MDRDDKLSQSVKEPKGYNLVEKHKSIKNLEKAKKKNKTGEHKIIALSHDKTYTSRKISDKRKKSTLGENLKKRWCTIHM